MKKTLALSLIASLIMLSLSAMMPVMAEVEDGPFTPFEETVVLTHGRSVGTGLNIPEEDSIDNNVYTRYVENRVNVRVEHTWALDAEAANQKLALALTSGEIPDVMIVNRMNFLTLVESELIQPMGDVFEKYASNYLLDAYGKYQDNACLESATIDGQLMAIPNTNLGYQHDITWLRQDWLDEMGLTAPTDMDGLIELAKKFMERDPEIVGFTLNASIAGEYNGGHNFNVVTGLFKAYPRIWYEKDGRVVYGTVQPEMRDALEFIAKMYADGLIDKQFAVRDQNEVVISGKSGIFFGPWWMPFACLMNSFLNDGADWMPYNIPLDSEGKFNTVMPVPSQDYLVVSNGCTTPEAVIKVLNAENEFNFFEFNDEDWLRQRYQATEQGLNWGVMPFALHIANPADVPASGIALNNAIDLGDPSSLHPFLRSQYDLYLQYLDNPADGALWAEKKARIDGMIMTQRPENTYVTPAFWDMTETMIDKWATLKKMEDEILVKIVMGEAPIEDFDAFVNDWNRLGGEQITEEVNAWANK